jgi:hypothetical protein
MKNEVFQVVEEYKLAIDEAMRCSVRARILKRVKGEVMPKFEWEISHYCKQSKDDMDVYIPSGIYRDTIEEARDALFSYLEKFTNIDVQVNNLY